MSTAIAPIDEVRKSLTLMESQFKAALPSHIDPKKFIRTVLTAVQTNPQILEANRTSLYASCMKAASDGLICDGREAALVVYNSKQGKQVNYLPMVAGILKKVRNSGELLSLTAQIVYEHDKFDYWLDDQGEHLEHRPQMFGDRKGMLGAYAIARTKDGGTFIEVMTSDQIDAVRKASRASESGPWAGPFATEMAKKSVIKRLAKRLPMSTDLEQALSRDEELYDFQESSAPTEREVRDEPKEEPSKKPKRLGSLIKKTKEPEPEETDEEITEIIDVPPPSFNKREDLPL